MHDEIAEWFAAKLPEAWFDDLRVIADKDEILVMGTLPEGRDTAAFREETREERIAIAAAAESLFRRKVTWGARSGDTKVLFTHLSVPVMTRLRIDERHVLDTLVSAGVARSRSDALGWCVRLVAQHEGDWLAELRDALGAVEEVRKRRSA